MTSRAKFGKESMMDKGESKSKNVPNPPGNYLLQKLKSLDVQITNKLALASSNESRLGYLRPHMKLLEFSCHGIPWLGGCTIILFMSSGRDTRAFMGNLYIALILDIICVAVMKALTRRRRPESNHTDMFMTLSVDKLSFPSGHVTRAVLVTSIFTHQLGLSAIPSFLLHLWCISVSVSRVLLGRHHVGDVLGGLALGWCEHWLVSLLWLSTDSAVRLLSIFMSTDVDDNS